MLVHEGRGDLRDVIGNPKSWAETSSSRIPLSAMAQDPAPYDESDRESIRNYGLKVKGLTAREVCKLSGMGDPSVQPNWRETKSILGDVMEKYFQIRKNNSPVADFPQAGVELKVLPLKRGRSTGNLLVKEPTSISMIDYRTLPSETWERPATVRKKLEHILFVFFLIDSVDIMASTVKAVELWDASDPDRALFRIDWEDTRKKVAEGRADCLSEADARVLCARRKGVGGTADLRRYRTDAPPAPSRAWALKTAFTRQILEERVLGIKFESVLPPPIAQSDPDLLARAVERISSVLAPFEGRSLRAVAEAKGLKLARGKNLAATIIKKALGFKNVNAKMRELEQLGVAVKTLNLRLSDGWPFEAVSFPAVKLRELVEEEWEGIEGKDGNLVKEGSQLRDQLRSVLFVPTFSEHAGVAQEMRVIGRPFLWGPSEQEWATIRREWEMFRREVAEGKARYHPALDGGRRMSGLTKASQTTIIHMRPHGRTAHDEDIDPLGNRVTKQSFWLNQPFLQKIVRARAWPPPGPDVHRAV